MKVISFDFWGKYICRQYFPEREFAHNPPFHIEAFYTFLSRKTALMKALILLLIPAQQFLFFRIKFLTA